MTTKEYKRFKGLKKENLRDNMTNKELVLNMLAEISTKEISESKNPEKFIEHMEIAKQGGEVARNARLDLEQKTGRKVVTSLNAKQIQTVQLDIPISDNSEDLSKESEDDLTE